MKNKRYFCKKCKLFWRRINKEKIEYNIFIFDSINPKKCPYCKDPTLIIPKNLKELREKANQKKKYRIGKLRR